MTRTRQPKQGDTVIVMSEEFTYEGTVVDVLSSQFTYRVHKVNGQPAPSSSHHRWVKFCFFEDDWHIKKLPIDNLDLI